MDLSVELAPRHLQGLRLRNPVIVASGTFGYGLEYAKLTDIQRLGAIISKGITLRPRRGNPPPRIVETAAGMLNAIGLENIGVDAVVEEKAPIWAGWQAPVIVNIAAESLDDYAAIALRLDGVPGISGVEVNVSCPNSQAGGLYFGTSPAMAAEVTRVVKQSTQLPVIVKLTPNVTDIAAVATAVAVAGADAVSLINTLVGMRIDIASRRPLLGYGTGGLSGPAIKPVALYQVYRVAQAVDIPVIGIGGIMSAEDAVEFFMAGASAVQIGTANFRRPNAAVEVIDGIERYLNEHRIDDIADLIGVAQQQKAVPAIPVG